ncbi:MAG: hypothetical protein R3B47_05730 [Bacteroidia bacterium]
MKKAVFQFALALLVLAALASCSDLLKGTNHHYDRRSSSHCPEQAKRHTAMNEEGDMILFSEDIDGYPDRSGRF